MLRLSDEARSALVGARDRHGKADVRERAAALLQLADGVPGTRVARHGRLRPRSPATIDHGRERDHYRGLAGLLHRPGRGRTPRGQPPAPGPTPAGAPPAPAPSRRAAARDGVRRDPPTLGVALRRWTLPTLRTTCPWLGPARASGLWRLLRRLGSGLKRGRDWVPSPDPASVAKQAAITVVRAAALHEPRVSAC